MEKLKLSLILMLSLTTLKAMELETNFSYPETELDEEKIADTYLYYSNLIPFDELEEQVISGERPLILLNPLDISNYPACSSPTTLFGTSGIDFLEGGFTKDVITGLGDSDYINGCDNDDTISGNKGNDTLLGGNGEDLIYGSFGSDIIFGEAQGDRIFGGDDTDYLMAGDGDDYVDGGEGDDFISGGNGDDIIHSGYGEKEIHGGANNDLIFAEGSGVYKGNKGNDKLVIKNSSTKAELVALDGGDGSDIFVQKIDKVNGVTYIFGGNGFDILHQPKSIEEYTIFRATFEGKEIVHLIDEPISGDQYSFGFIIDTMTFSIEKFCFHDATSGVKKCYNQSELAIRCPRVCIGNGNGSISGASH